jgi:hypothetical protein
MTTRGYWREISAVLVAKTIAIIALYCLFIAPSGPSSLTPAKVADHLMPPGAPSAATGIQP